MSQALVPKGLSQHCLALHHTGWPYARPLVKARHDEPALAKHKDTLAFSTFPIQQVENSHGKAPVSHLDRGRLKTQEQLSEAQLSAVQWAIGVVHLQGLEAASVTLCCSAKGFWHSM